MTTREAAAYLLERHGYRVAAGTLENWRYKGLGPKHYAGRGRQAVQYIEAWLDEWVAEQIVDPRAEGPKFQEISMRTRHEKAS